MDNKYFQYINDILDFYNNQKLCSGYDNRFFNEGNPEEWVLPRLERAAKDQVCNNLLNVRCQAPSYQVIIITRFLDHYSIYCLSPSIKRSGVYANLKLGQL